MTPTTRPSRRMLLTDLSDFDTTVRSVTKCTMCAGLCTHYRGSHPNPLNPLNLLNPIRSEPQFILGYMPYSLFYGGRLRSALHRSVNLHMRGEEPVELKDIIGLGWKCSCGGFSFLTSIHKYSWGIYHPRITDIGIVTSCSACGSHLDTADPSRLLTILRTATSPCPIDTKTYPKTTTGETHKSAINTKDRREERDRGERMANPRKPYQTPTIGT